MKIAMLTKRNGRHTQNRPKVTAEERGYGLDVIDPFRCTTVIREHPRKLSHEGRPLTDYDAVIPLLTPSTAAFGLAVLRQFECMGVVSFNSSAAIAGARDKLQSLPLLAQGGVAVPATGFAHEAALAKQMVETVG